MRFTKMQGAGNDYVYINAFEEALPGDLPELARQIADRHFGVGGDGMVLIGPSDVATARMRMFNADGSESEMCGNAIRCVGKYLYDHGISTDQTLTIQTGRGVLTLDLEVDDGLVEQARVDVGEPILAAADVPTTLPGEQIIDYPLPAGDAAWLLAGAEEASHWAAACGLDPRITCVSMGNPHAVLYCRDVAKIPLETVGPVLEHHAAFPRRMNIHFVQIHSPDEVTMRTWERGSGITLACGTGASAVCVAGVLTGRTARSLLAHLPGGDLRLEWRAADNRVLMTGPAVEVFSGDWLPRRAASLGFKLA